MRKRYLVSYDISDDKRRSSIAKILEANGDRIQYSVFLCEWNPMELQRAKGQFINCMNMKRDQLIVVNLGPSKNRLESRLETIGKKYVPPPRALVV